jgi:hypothetical protein
MEEEENEQEEEEEEQQEEEEEQQEEEEDTGREWHSAQSSPSKIIGMIGGAVSGIMRSLSQSSQSGSSPVY